MIRAKDTIKGKVYRRTRHGDDPWWLIYYEVPNVGRAAYEARLRAKYKKHALGGGQETANLRDLAQDPDAVLLRRTIRYRAEGESRYSETSSLVVVSPDLKLRAVQRKPTR